MNFQTNEGKSRVTQQYQDDYEQDYEHEDLKVIVQQKQPQQKVISLMQGQPSNQQHAQFRNEKDDIEQKQKLVAKLKGILNLKLEQIKEVKNNILNCKKQIKDIGEEVDKQMNKSILKHAKPHTSISIKQIFQTTKSSDPQVNKLTSQLEKVRAQAKKVKVQLKTIETQVKSPLNVINAEKATQIKSKIKQAELELKTIKQQKQYLQEQVKMRQLDDGDNDISNVEQIKNNIQKNASILNQFKEQKNKMYQLQKQDRILTQKIRFIGELEEQVQMKKSKSLTTSIMPKQQIEASIRQVIEQINQILQKRNKIQSERKNFHKSLENDVAAVEGKNWQIINKLRQIDAKLIKHYNSKLKKTKAKKEPTNQKSQFEEPQKIRQKPIQSYGNTIKTIYSSAKNDKNFQPIQFQHQPPVLVEKRKVYQFFINSSQNQPLGNIVLNDQMLGNKLIIKRLNFVLDQNTLYGISADYENQHKKQIKGYKIMSRIKPKDVLTKAILIDQDKNEVLNYIQVGISKDQSIKYLHIITSEAKQFKWGNLQICEKSQQKNIRKYENIVIKGKLNQISDKEAPNYYCLAGLGFTIVYLSPK